MAKKSRRKSIKRKNRSRRHRRRIITGGSGSFSAVIKSDELLLADFDKHDNMVSGDIVYTPNGKFYNVKSIAVTIIGRDILYNDIVIGTVSLQDNIPDNKYNITKIKKSKSGVYEFEYE